ncbi:unnamed protein product [Leuciscus chuanchicus]
MEMLINENEAVHNQRTPKLTHSKAGELKASCGVKDLQPHEKGLLRASTHSRSFISRAHGSHQAFLTPHAIASPEYITDTAGLIERENADLRGALSLATVNLASPHKYIFQRSRFPRFPGLTSAHASHGKTTKSPLR